MLSQEVKQRINTARQILVGKVPDPKAQVEQITTALIYKFMDDMDQQNEMLGGKPQFFIEELKKFSWRRLMSPELSGQERWDLYTRALIAFSKSEKVPGLFRTIFKDAYLPYRDPETLNLFLKVINEFTYDHSEELGNAYEYLLSILGSQGDAGQFRTPRHIIDFIVEVVDPKKENTILDPACGTAGFLISAYKHIWRHNSSNFDEKNYIPTFAENITADASSIEVQKNGGFKGDKLTPDDRKRLAKNIVGYDISPDMVRLSLVNMYLHGFTTPRIYEYDTLTYEDRWDETFDIIFANPPFMTPKGGIRPHKRFQVQANRAEVLFVDYIAEHLNINGKAGIIVPEGIIFQSARAYKNLRKNLVENWGLYAVVSLPPGVFQPYSGVKTSILFIDKALSKKTDEILFIKVENDGFDLGAQRRRIDKNDLPEAYEILKKWQRGEKSNSKLALWVKKEKLAEGGEYNLTGDKYKEVVDYSKVKWPMVRLGDERFFKIESGGTPSSKISEYWDGNINWVTLVDLPAENIITNITKTKRTITELGLKKSSAKLLPEKTVLVSSRATIGRIGIARIPLATNQGFKNIIIKDFSKVNEKFVAYILLKLIPQMENLASGGTYKEISKTSFSNLEIPLPPLEVQKEIVAELDSYQKIIDGARQVIENWKPKIKIDPDWPKIKLGEVCEKITDGSHFSPKASRDGYPYITVKDIVDNKIDFTNAKRINEFQYKKLLKSGCKPNKNDILFSKDGTVGKVAIVNFENDFVVLSSLAIISPNIKKLHPLFLFYLLQDSEIVGKALGMMKGIAIRRVILRDLKTLTIPLPPLETQQQIVSEIEKEQKIIDQLKELIKIYEQRIKDKIAEVWGERK